MNDQKQAQKTKRNNLFLKGPIDFQWINNNIADPTARLLLIALSLIHI